MKLKTLQSQKRQKSTSTEINYVSISTNPESYLSNKDITDPLPSPLQQNQVDSQPNTVGVQTEVEKVEICTRYGRTIKAPQRFRR